MSKKIMLLSIFLLLLLLVMFYFLIFYDFSEKKDKNIIKEKTEKVFLPNSNTIKDKEIIVESENKVDKNKEQESLTNNDNNDVIKFNLKKKAQFFVERLGSYSNQSQFDNVKDLRIFMTDNMKKWADEYIKTGMKKDYSGEYIGTTVKSVSSSFVEFDNNNGLAIIKVNIQKKESTSTTDSDVLKEKVTVSFVRENDKWFVDKVKWE